MVGSEWRIENSEWSLLCRPNIPIRYSLFAIRPFLLLLRLNLGRRLHLHSRLEAGAVDGAVDVVDQLGNARGVAAQVALEIARRGADIDPRSLAVGRHPDRDVLAKSHH